MTLYIYIYIYSYMYICMYVCMYIYIYIHNAQFTVGLHEAVLDPALVRMDTLRPNLRSKKPLNEEPRVSNCANFNVHSSCGIATLSDKNLLGLGWKPNGFRLSISGSCGRVRSV